ncbi:MAG TPA: hypothetical protein VM056_07285 [Terriglobales bacterium]|nr:hypothetical protein [Terriglobales bacterium]
MLKLHRFALLSLFSISLAVAQTKPAVEANGQKYPGVAELQKMRARYAPTAMWVNTAHLSRGDQKALALLIQAARLMDILQLEQRWSGNTALYAELMKDNTPLGRERLHYFWINKGPWSALDEHKAFIPNAPEKKPLGANFYPEDTTKEELEAWMKTLSKEDKEQAEWFFTTIRRDDAKRFKIVPYSQEYAPLLAKVSGLLKAAAESTTNESLRKFLSLRADAFLSNDYFASDVAWMDLDSPVDVTIGPYETYNDELFGYKAAFEAYINIRDEKESAKLKFFSKHLQDIENNLPIPEQHRNPKIGALSPITVVNQVLGAGDGNMGVQTAAYNLPNDERVIQQKGSKRVMLKNVQQAKFNKTLVPISKVVLPPAARKDLDFELFFTHILAHELTHGLGPHGIKISGRESTPRQELKELYSTIEEAKADVTGLFALQHLMDKGLLKDSLGQGAVAERKMYTTFLASAFRTLRFGVTSSHARGMAIQFNYLLDKGAYRVNKDGTFAVDFTRIKQAIRELDRDLLMLEATGDYAGAKKMMTELSVIRPPVQKAIDRLKSAPTDIEPIFLTANRVVPDKSAVPIVMKPAAPTKTKVSY